jgi:hypothetical protein
MTFSLIPEGLRRDFTRILRRLGSILAGDNPF